MADGCEDEYTYGETEDYCVTITAASGYADTFGEAVRFFPNPSDEGLFVELPAPSFGTTLTVLDNTGRTVLRQALNQPRTLLYTADFATGLYLFRISDRTQELGRGKFEVAHD